jgi:hypothetical protein
MLKPKPEKVKNGGNEIVKLDELHRKQAEGFDSRRNNLKDLVQQREELEREYFGVKMEQFKESPLLFTKRRAEIKERLTKIKDEIYDIENGVSELEYYSKINDVLIDYYTDESNSEGMSETMDEEYDEEEEEAHNGSDTMVTNKLRELQQSQQKRKPKKATRRRMRKNDLNGTVNILDFFTGTDTTIVDNKEQHQPKQIEFTVTNKATLLNTYMKIVNNVSIDRDRRDKLRMCGSCGIEKTVFQSEGICVCVKCGETESIVIESEIPSHKDTVVEKVHYPYKRANHLSEWLNQFQAKESTDIPDTVIEAIREELKKKRITNKNKITIQRVKGILKKLKMSEYYEHSVYIVSKLTDKPPPSLSREMEEKIKYMFKQVQEPFSRHCPASRINFLSYSYVLHKIFRILDLPYVHYFELLKSKEKLRAQEIIWEKICNDLEWTFYSSMDILV